MKVKKFAHLARVIPMLTILVTGKARETHYLRPIIRSRDADIGAIIKAHAQS